jgi:hemolysin activation/secretion protein
MTSKPSLLPRAIHAVSAVSVLSAASLALFGPGAWAQSSAPVPSVGDVVRDLLPAAKPKLPALTEAPVAKPAAPKAEPAAPTFTFSRLVLKGADTVSEAQVQALGQPFASQPMGEEALAALLQALRQRLDQSGMSLAAIGLPRIDMATGVVTVDVVEPKLGRLTVPLGDDAPVSEARVRGLMSWFGMAEGGPLDVDALERVMFALNDMPGVQAKAKLTPSGDEGIYNLAVQLAPRRSWDGSVSADNQGLGAIGRLRLSASARLNDPFGLGDNFDVQGLLSDTLGVKVGRVGYELPVAYTPVRLAMAASHLRYELGGGFKSLGASGKATLLEGSLSYPLIRARTRTLLGRVGLDDKHFQDHMDDFPLSDGDRRLRTLVMSLSWESRDAYWGGGFWGGGLTQRFGKLSYGNTPDANQAHAGNFNKTELQVSRLQTLTGPFTGFLALGHQRASRNLDPAEKIGLGGSRGVRAYAVAEMPSDDGTIVNAEVRWWLDRNWTVFALTDWAHGRLDHEGSGQTVTLRGTGLGLSASFPDWVNVRATLAWRTSRASVADPGHDKPRLAIQAQHSF